MLNSDKSSSLAAATKMRKEAENRHLELSVKEEKHGHLNSAWSDKAYRVTLGKETYSINWNSVKNTLKFYSPFPF